MQRIEDPIAFAEEQYEQAIADSPTFLPPEEFEDAKDTEWEEGENYSRSIRLSTGLIVTFRDPTADDLEFVELLTGGNISKTKRLACRLCIKWGERGGVTPPQIGKVRAKDMMLISRVIESFLV